MAIFTVYDPLHPAEIREPKTFRKIETAARGAYEYGSRLMEISDGHHAVAWTQSRKTYDVAIILRDHADGLEVLVRWGDGHESNRTIHPDLESARDEISELRDNALSTGHSEWVPWIDMTKYAAEQEAAKEAQHQAIRERLKRRKV